MSKADEPSRELTNTKGDSPHNSRFFPAGLTRILPGLAQKALIWTVLVTLILINAAMALPSIRTKAQWFYTLVQPLKQHTAIIGQNQAQSTSVLGAIDDQSEQTMSQLHYEILQKQYAYWQIVVSDHPDYRDGYYALAVLAYELGRNSDAVIFLRQVRAIDPNFVNSERLQSVLQN